MSGAELDFRSLEEEFKLDPVSNQSTEIAVMRDRIAAAEAQGDADKILRLNIERANYLLDLAEQEFNNGALNARTLEACARIIAEVTSAANSLKNLEIQQQNLDLKERTLNLKDFEVKSKLTSSKEQQQGIPQTQVNSTTNVIVTDRENLLKMLQQENIIDV